MRISLDWLSGMLPLDKANAVDIADSLTQKGIEVESIEFMDHGFEKVVCGRIVSMKKHPDADKLSVLGVDTGSGVLQIVCGANNMKENDKVALALEGACLPNGMIIKKSKIRGVESRGMCCSEQELGLSRESRGIIILPEDTVPGCKVAEVLGRNDVIFEISVPPNRGDLLGHLGVARELASAYKNELCIGRREYGNLKKGNGGLTVKIVDERCTRYIGRMIRGVKISRSPEWLCRKVEAAGLRPINNLVDITNYVMFEYGHPLHVFDAGLVGENSIIVRKPAERESITLLDGSELKLNGEDIVIADSNRPLALAGVMGGRDSGVFDTTVDVILECAYFDPASIRVTAKKHGIATDSSYRFERGVDFVSMPDVVERATSLIAELANAKEIFDSVDVIAKKPDQPEIMIDPVKAGSFLGLELQPEYIKGLLSGSFFKISDDENLIRVCPPSFRNDIKVKEDVYEEIARLAGYNSIPSTMPPVIMEMNSLNNGDDFYSVAKKAMKSLGYLEAITYSFVPENYHGLLGYKENEAVRILNPISETMKYMRVSLLPSLLEAVRYNLNHRNMDIKLFEIGKTYLPGDKNVSRPGFDESVVREKEFLCSVCTGRVLNNEDWGGNGNIDFFRVKGELDALFASLKVPKWGLDKMKGGGPLLLHPGFSTVISCCGRDAGFIGKIHPDLAEKFELTGTDVFVFELDLAVVRECFGSATSFREIPRFPLIRRDLSFIVGNGVSHEDISSVIRKKRITDLANFGIFDFYTGKGIPEGKKSLAYYFIFSNKERTLVDNEVDESIKKVLEILINEFGIEIR
ncbi:MAG: phenylalanine--tRNA ligase subunit beta [Oligoflexia bacterium]|nr:phenylalanine--tRNA ligase subunit beta [Oligoflexia bacterium]